MACFTCRALYCTASYTLLKPALVLCSYKFDVVSHSAKSSLLALPARLPRHCASRTFLFSPSPGHYSQTSDTVLSLASLTRFSHSQTHARPLDGQRGQCEQCGQYIQCSVDCLHTHALQSRAISYPCESRLSWVYQLLLRYPLFCLFPLRPFATAFLLALSVPFPTANSAAAVHSKRSQPLQAPLSLGHEYILGEKACLLSEPSSQPISRHLPLSRALLAPTSGHLWPVVLVNFSCQGFAN